MAVSIDSLTLFPLVFAALVLQKTYLVSKQALVPSVVRTEAELVEANSKLGVIAGLTGFVAVIPAGAAPADAARGLGHAGLLRRRCSPYALASATRLPADVVAAAPTQPAERAQLHSAGLQLAARGHDDAAGRGRVRVLPPRVLAARRRRPARRWFGAGRRAVGARHDGRQRRRAAAARGRRARS